MKRTLRLMSLALLLPLNSFAEESFVVRDIRVEGIQRTEAGTVFNYLPIRVGDTFDNEKATQVIRALFATGFFRDVRIEVEGDVLVVLVEERPAIAQVDFVGLKEFDKDQIKKGLKDLGLAESRILDRALLEKAEQELKRQYLSRGKYATKVTTVVTPQERNRVNVTFNIEEGDVAKIRQINIIGAKAFNESQLLDLFQLRTPNWISWLTRNDQYSKQKLSADLEALRSFYLDRGYVEFNIESTQVSISPDKKDVFLTLSINEGERFTISGVKVAGDLMLPEEEFRRLVTLRVGELFSRERLNESTKAISDRLGREGYAFANVNVAPELDREKKEVSLTLFVDPGRRAYVRRINIGGNTKTRDEVIRREIRQMEGGWYDADRIARSRERINRLGYFSDVTVETPAVPGTTDQVDVNLNVAERPTGNLMLGVGYSSAEKLVLTGSVSQENLFGTGKHIALQINSGKINQVYSISYTDPYFTVDGISQGFDLYRRSSNPSSLSVGNYQNKTTGGGVRFGFPIAETESFNVSLSGEKSDITVDRSLNGSPKRYIDFVDTFGNPTTSIVAGLSWVNDSRDSSYYPTKGGIRRVSAEIGTPAGDLRYYRSTLSLQHFFPLNRDFTLWTNAEYSQADGLGSKELPFFKGYYGGGIGSVRGYDTASLGPCADSITGEVLPVCTSGSDRIGGNRRVVANVELLAPLPGSGLDRSVRLATFVDAGQVYGKDQKVDLGDLRYSAGVALAWFSPIGPMKFSWAKPLNLEAGDRAERFQFQLGTAF
jgi:outer membrane protein insertion porin family